MLRKLAASLIFPVVVVASNAACTAETAETSADLPADLPSGTVDTKATDGVFCTYNSQGIGRGPYSGYYSRAQCDAYAQGCGKSVILYQNRNNYMTTFCFFQ